MHVAYSFLIGLRRRARFHSQKQSEKIKAAGDFDVIVAALKITESSKINFQWGPNSYDKKCGTPLKKNEFKSSYCFHSNRTQFLVFVCDGKSFLTRLSTYRLRKAKFEEKLEPCRH